MLTVLTDIFHGILELPYLLVNLLIESVNGWILAIAALIKLLAGLLPGFPDIPAFPESVTAPAAWFFPVKGVLIVFATMLAAWLVFMGAKIALNWGKVKM